MKISDLEKTLGYTFKNAKLLERALTHRSWAHENGGGSGEEPDNETLEFVGDSVLGLVIAEHLFKANPTLEEGGLTLMKHHLVSMPTLARISARIGLGKYVRIGRGEDKTGGREKPAILADTFEAVVGAIFVDSGYVPARVFLVSAFREEFKNATPGSSLDYKTLLQETLQAEKLSAPTYELLRTEGKPHARTFYIKAVWETGTSEGSGPSRKAAEMNAADAALKMLKRSGEDVPVVEATGSKK